MQLSRDYCFITSFSENDKLFIKTNKGNALKLSYNVLKNMEKFLKKEAPSKEGASY